MSPYAIPGAEHARGSILTALLDRILDRRAVEIPLDSTPSPIEEISLSSPEVSGALAFWVGPRGGLVPATAVKAGDSVQIGQAIVEGSMPVLSPVGGTVTGVMSAPDVRGRKGGVAVIVEPAADGARAVFDPLDPATAPVASLRERVARAGIMTAEIAPRPLLDLLDSGANGAIITLGADREPGVSAVSQLLRERTEDALLAAALVARMAGSTQATLAVLNPLVQVVRLAPGRRDVAVVGLEPTYPAALESLVAARVGAGSVVVPLETALAALDAVRDGVVASTKVVTVIGPKKKRGNYRVPLGCRLKDLLAAVGLRVRERDKVVAGGPMRGFAQYSLDAAIDTGIDAVMVIRAGAVVPWSDEPCINCGACIDACPVRLQVQSIGRNAEFGLFEATRSLDIDACIECGLCAAVCTTRRPLLQLIRLAKRELEQSVVVLPAEASVTERTAGTMEAAS